MTDAQLRSYHSIKAAAAGFALLFATAGLTGCEPEKATAGAPQPRSVRIQTVVFHTAERTRTFAGVVRARIETDLAFRIGGKIVSRAVDVGDFVRAGEPLAVLDDSDAKLQVESARAELDAARSALAQVRADLGRVATLEEKGWASNASSDKQKAAADEASGRVVRAERALQLAENQLSYVTLRADADGVVTASSIEAGQVISAGQTALRVARLEEKEALVALPETSVVWARGATACVELWSQPGKTYRTKLRELSPVADPATRTFAARFSIENADDGVALGMTATVTLQRQEDGPVATLPLSAIYDDGHGPSVWVVNQGGALTQQPVAIVSYGSEEVTVRSGVAEGDKVVALGASTLDRDQRVRIVSADSGGSLK